jgi:hypothetical protein
MPIIFSLEQSRHLTVLTEPIRHLHLRGLLQTPVVHLPPIRRQPKKEQAKTGNTSIDIPESLRGASSSVALHALPPLSTEPALRAARSGDA